MSAATSGTSASRALPRISLRSCGLHQLLILRRAAKPRLEGCRSGAVACILRGPLRDRLRMRISGIAARKASPDFAPLHPGYNVSRRVRGPHAPRDLRPALALHHPDIVLALQVEPELRAIAEIAAKPHGRVGGDRAPGVEDIGDAAGRHADIEREPIGAQCARAQFTFEETAGMHDRRHCHYPW